MYLLYKILIIGQFLSFNPTLDQVAINRQTLPVHYEINEEMNVKKYDCLIGVPYGHGDLIGNEVYFVSDYEMYGPYLVVDVESDIHSGIMDSRNLLADINCKDMVHKKGFLIGVK